MRPIAPLIPDERIPGRYLVIGYVGSKEEHLHTWQLRSHAERIAGVLIAEGRSELSGKRFDRITVEDQVNRTVIWEWKQPAKGRV